MFVMILDTSTKISCFHLNSYGGLRTVALGASNLLTKFLMCMGRGNIEDNCNPDENTGHVIFLIQKSAGISFLLVHSGLVVSTMF